jgi:hypothetical protein
MNRVVVSAKIEEVKLFRKRNIAIHSGEGSVFKSFQPQSITPRFVYLGLNLRADVQLLELLIFCIGMHAVTQEYINQIMVWIGPAHSTCETRMTKTVG